MRDRNELHVPGSSRKKICGYLQLQHVLRKGCWSHAVNYPMYRKRSLFYCPLSQTCLLFPPLDRHLHMEQDLLHLRDDLLHAWVYAANPVFTQGLGWCPENSGNILIDNDSTENAVSTVVGCVVRTCLNCDTHGNFVSCNYGDLSTTKFQLLLGKPMGTTFADDFDKFIAQLEKIQGGIASTQIHENFIVVERHDKVLHFTQCVFKKRVSTLAQSIACSFSPQLFG
jgi:hypothetical protein